MPGVLGWLRDSMGESRGSMASAFGALEEFVNPAAARAREELHEQNERVMPTPSPGDRLLDEGRIVLRRHTPAEDASDADPGLDTGPEPGR